MAFHQLLPCLGPFVRVRDLAGVAAGIDGLEVAELSGLRGNSDRNAIVLLDIRELLARSVDQEDNFEALVRIAHDCRLRPSVGTNRRDRHDATGIEDLDGNVLHSNLQRMTSADWAQEQGSNAISA